MSRKMMIAVAIQVVAMLWVVVPPMIVSNTGTVIYLETMRVDPRAMFRGDYVILAYQQTQEVVPQEMAKQAADAGQPVYVTFTTERPAQFVEVGLEPPELEEGQVCIIGRVRRFRGRAVDRAEGPNAVDFPQIAQYFVPEGEGRALEERLDEEILARVAVSGSCDAVLLGLEVR